MYRQLIRMTLVVALGFGTVVTSGTALGASNGTPELLEGKSMLREHVIVDENVIRLSDLFTNVTERAEAAVAYSPQAGKRAVLDARWLYRVARAYNVDWKPLSAKVTSTVERDSISVPLSEIKAEILFALADYNVGAEMDLEFSTRFTELHLPAGSVATINVDNVNYHDRTGRFTAMVSVGEGAHTSDKVRLSGRAYQVAEVPVLTNRVLRGDIIKSADVKWVRMRANRVQTDVLQHMDDIIGMTPKRGLRANVPIRVTDVQRPRLVEKNDLVTIVHHVPNMILTAQGKALQHGANGDIVQVKNAQSTQVIEAEVIGPGRVAVRTVAQQLSLNVN